MSDFLHGALLVLIVVGLFNLIIFVHELGHFLAARWRGLQVDRFQIWFGKPIWKKEINGVQYGLGWLPAGGFVALPQMAPMESIEGTNRDAKSLPKVKPLDKIIVAFAGPLFSILLAFAAAFLVWKIGKPQDAITNTVIGGIVPESPAEKAGLLAGDRILEINGEPVTWFSGDYEAVSERIMLTEENQITFKVDRDGEEHTFVSNFEIPETKFWQRRALPRVGIAPSHDLVIGAFIESENQTPAERAGLEVGDQISKLNGVEVYGRHQFSLLMKEAAGKPLEFTVIRDGQELEKVVTPLVPNGDYYNRPMLGISWDPSNLVSSERVYPTPLSQIGSSLKTMWVTISSVASPNSKVGWDQLAGPIGIAKMKFRLLQTEDGWLRVLWFFVLFNVNLAVLNMLPFPVLDGGHIVIAGSEMLFGRPVNARFLEVVQTGFALFLMGFMFLITTKDIGDDIGREKMKEPPEVISWPEAPATAPAPVE